MLLLAALKLGIYKLEQVKEAGGFLAGILPLLFIPAAVGVMDLWAELEAMLLPCLIAVIPVTLLVMGVTGRVTQKTRRALEKGVERDGWVPVRQRGVGCGADHRGLLPGHMDQPKNGEGVV